MLSEQPRNYWMLRRLECLPSWDLTTVASSKREERYTRDVCTSIDSPGRAFESHSHGRRDVAIPLARVDLSNPPRYDSTYSSSQWPVTSSIEMTLIWVFQNEGYFHAHISSPYLSSSFFCFPISTKTSAKAKKSSRQSSKLVDT